MAEPTIAPATPATPGLAGLVAASDAFHRGLYPDPHCYLVPLEELAAENVRLFAARAGTGPALGCVALVLHEGADGRWGEVKRLFVAETARGLGLGARLMRHLEDEARKEGCQTVRLETGTRQPESVRLYERLGYRPTGPFGPYPENPYSLFFEKALQPLSDSSS